jgi:hypothetical protein
MSDYLPYPRNGPVYKDGSWIQPSEQRANYERDISNRQIRTSRPRTAESDCTNNEILAWIIRFIFCSVLLYYWAMWIKSGADDLHLNTCVLRKPRQHHC